MKNLNVDFFLFRFQVQSHDLPSSASDEQHLRGTTEHNLLNSELRVIAEWIINTDLQVTTYRCMKTLVQHTMARSSSLKGSGVFIRFASAVVTVASGSSNKGLSLIHI